MERIKYYYKLTKPGIVRGNSIAVVAGFLLASQGKVDSALLGWVLLGSALVMAGGCVLNNFIDRDIDKKMTRTQQRAIVNGKISPINALIYGGILALVGFVVLYNFTNNLTVYVGLGGFIFYVYIYAYFKRKTEHATLIGSISGAVPPLAGYVAVSNVIDEGAVIVFLILVFWQLPHFYAISIFRHKEYFKANIPLVSVTRGISATKKYVLAYMPIYFAVSLLPYFYDLAGETYFLIMVGAGLYWMYVAVSNYGALEPDKWARKVFGSSLLVLLVFAVAVFLDTVLPGVMV